MAGLEITKDGAKYIIEPLGKVTQDNAAIGNWNTNDKNQIVIIKNDGTKVNIDADWKFNADNHLVVSADGKEFDFHSVTANRVVYSIETGILVVNPASGKTFKFELFGSWDLTEDHDLKFTVNKKSSVIDGNVADREGRFFFVFKDKSAAIGGGSTLKFAGEWKEEITDNGKLFLKFHYKQRGSLDVKTFSLPKEVTFSTALNQLMYSYNKGNKTQIIQFFGTLLINENFQIMYTLNRQTEGGKEMTKSTTFTLDAVYAKDNLSGNLNLAIQKSNGSASATNFVIGGGFTAIIGATDVKAGFSFAQTKQDGGKTAKKTFGFNAEIVHKANKFQIQFLTENTIKKTIELEVGTQIRIGPADVDSKLTVKKENGELVAVTFLLGVSI